MARTIEGGITLVDLTDGQSYYTFVRYSENADGSGYVPTPSSKTIYIGVYAGPLSSPPVYSDRGWTWSKYVGDDGGQGPQGVSVTSGRELYYLTTTGTAPSRITAANQIVSTDTPNRWSSVVATYQTGADYYTCIETTLSNGQKVWSTPSKNIALTTASADAQEAKTIATGINQYFWWIPNDHSTSVKAGVYMTQIPSATFKNTPAGGNIIMRSDGMYIRHGATLDAQVTSSGLIVKKGGIEAGTFNSNNYVYAWSEDRSDRALAINGSGSKTDWRFLAGKQFGVDKAGNLYASNVNISGIVTIGAGSNVYNKDEVDGAIDDIDIGGRNLLRGSATQDTSLGNQRQGAIETTDTFLGCTVFKTAAAWNDIGFDFQIQCTNRDVVQAGDVLTYSIYAKTDDTISRDIWGVWVGNKAGGNHYSGSKIATLTSEWVRYEKQITVTQAMLESSTAATLTRFECNTACTSGKYIYWAAPKLEKGNKATDWTPAPEDLESYADNLQAQARPFVMGTQTAATGTWTGVCNELTELKEGQEILYFLPYAGSGNATLNLTLGSGTTTGAINCYYQNTTRLTTHFGAGMTIPLVYHKDFNIGGTNYTGWWTLSQYNTNNVDRKQMANAVRVGENHAAYCISARSGTGHKKVVSGLVIDLAYPICYLNQANASGQSYAVASGGTTTNFYTAIPSVTLRNNVANWTGTQYAMCYLKGTLAGNTFTVHSDVFTTVVPTSDDGFAYIPIGMTYSTYQVNFACDNSIYGYRNGSFGPLANREASAAQKTANDAAPKSEAIAQEQRVYYRSKVAGTVPKPTAWVTNTANKYNDTVSVGNAGWSTKVTPIASSQAVNAQKYLYLYTCIQRKFVNGTVTFTDVLLDDSTTVIDGGKIITGTVTANQIKANAVTTEKIAANAINASKISIRDYNNYVTVNENDTNSLVGIVSSTNANITDGWLYKINATAANVWVSPCLAKWATPGEQYRVTCKVKMPSAGRFCVNLYSRDANNALLGSDNTKIYTIAANTETEINDIITVTNKSGTVKNNIAVTFLPPAGTSGYSIGYWKELKVERMSGGSLIVDGAISADKITVGLQEAIKNGDNMLVDWDAPSLTKVNAPANRYWSDYANETYITCSIEPITNPPDTSIKYMQRFVGNGTNTSSVSRTYAFYSTNASTHFTAIPFKAGVTYTLSFWARASDLKVGIANLHVAGSVTDAISEDLNLTTEWKKYYKTFHFNTLPTNYYRCLPGVTFLANKAGTLEICGVSLVPEWDSTDASKRATDYVTKIDNDGIFVSPYSQNPTTNAPGNSVKIDGTGMNVYKGGVSVAFYGDMARIGREGYAHSVIDADGQRFYASDGTTQLANIGYGPGASESGTAIAPYYSLGWRTGTIGNWSVAEGNNTTASGYSSHAEGWRTTASGVISHAEGQDTIASSSYSHAEGRVTKATGSGSHAEGDGTTASGRQSHAEGYQTTASNHCSHAEGQGTTASGDFSHAEGLGPTASGYSSHAEGYGTTASGYSSHAEGRGTIAGGTYSHAQNYGTKASSDNQTAIGKWNIEDSQDTYALIVGNGTTEYARSNALTLSWDGDLCLYKKTSTTNDNPAELKFSIKDTNTGQTYSNAYIRAYQDHQATTNGTNMVIHSGGNIFLGSGEAPANHYALYKGSGSENSYITADNSIFVQSNGNTIANRVGYQLNASHQLVPCKEDVATDNIGSIGTSSYKWANIYATNLNGVAIGTNPKFTDTTYVAETFSAYLTIGPNTTSGGQTLSVNKSGYTPICVCNYYLQNQASSAGGKNVSMCNVFFCNLTASGAGTGTVTYNIANRGSADAIIKFNVTVLYEKN